jgi:hypothetical protein
MSQPINILVLDRDYVIGNFEWLDLVFHVIYLSKAKITEKKQLQVICLLASQLGVFRPGLKEFLMRASLLKKAQRLESVVIYNSDQPRNDITISIFGVEVAFEHFCCLVTGLLIDDPNLIRTAFYPLPSSPGGKKVKSMGMIRDVFTASTLREVRMLILDPEPKLLTDVWSKDKVVPISYYWHDRNAEMETTAVIEDLPRLLGTTFSERAKANLISTIYSGCSTQKPAKKEDWAQAFIQTPLEEFTSDELSIEEKVMASVLLTFSSTPRVYASKRTYRKRLDHRSSVKNQKVQYTPTNATW